MGEIPGATEEAAAVSRFPILSVNIPQHGDGRLHSICLFLKTKLVTVQMNVCMGRHKPETRRDKEGAEAMTSHMNSHSSMEQRTDDIRLSKSDRRLAKEQMRAADSAADFICRAAESLRSVRELLGGIFANRAR